MTPRVQPTAGVAAVADGRILLVRRADDGSWCLPGGRVDFGESVEDGARREFAEETGQAVELTGLRGVYSAPAHQIHRYPTGETVQFVAVVFDGRVGAGSGELAGDTTEARWFAADDLPRDLMASDVPAIRDALAERTRPIVD